MRTRFLQFDDAPWVSARPPFRAQKCPHIAPTTPTLFRPCSCFYRLFAQSSGRRSYRQGLASGTVSARYSLVCTQHIGFPGVLPSKQGTTRAPGASPPPKGELMRAEALNLIDTSAYGEVSARPDENCAHNVVHDAMRTHPQLLSAGTIQDTEQLDLRDSDISRVLGTVPRVSGTCSSRGAP